MSSAELSELLADVARAQKVLLGFIAEARTDFFSATPQVARASGQLPISLGSLHGRILLRQGDIRTCVVDAKACD